MTNGEIVSDKMDKWIIKMQRVRPHCDNVCVIAFHHYFDFVYSLFSPIPKLFNNQKVLIYDKVCHRIARFNKGKWIKTCDI